jgi:hypothetical protein
MKQIKNNHERGLVLPKNFVESYLTDLSEEEQLGIMNSIFTWYLTDTIPEIENKMVRVLFRNLLGFLEVSKKSYENGSLGGAPKGNQNAKKKTTMVDLENNPPCLTEQPLLKSETSLREEKRSEENRKEEKRNETRKENKIIQFDILDNFDFTDIEAQKLIDDTLLKKFNL